MKTIFISTLIFLPCLAVLNEGESIWPNIFGLAYIYVIFGLSWTKKGKRFCKRLYIEAEKFNEILFK